MMLTAANSSLLFSLPVVYPMGQTFVRAGLRPALALLVFLPGIGLLAGPSRRPPMMIGPDSLGVGWVEGLLALVGFTALFLWLAARVVRKTGYSGWWTLALFLPLLNIVAVWLFAFAPWPRVPQDGSCGAE